MSAKMAKGCCLVAGWLLAFAVEMISPPSNNPPNYIPDRVDEHVGVGMVRR